MPFPLPSNRMLAIAGLARPGEALPMAGGPGLPAFERRRLRIWFWSIAVMVVAVLTVGGITRLTRSGLSIVEWQPVTGVVPPLTDTQWAEAFERYRRFPEYQQVRRGMTIQEFKAIYAWEYLHRVLARLSGIVFLIPFVIFWRAGYFTRPLALRALALFGLGALQGGLGWLMVRSGLIDRPSVSHFRLAAHLGLAFVILGASVWLARDLAIRPTPAAVTAGARRLMMRGLALLGALLAAQIVWGALVAGLRAGSVFNTFPLMAGRLVPPDVMALAPVPLAFLQSLVTVQWTHRLVGTILLIASLAVFLRIRRAVRDRTSRRLSGAFVTLVACQYASGVLTLIYAVPVSLGVVHQLMAAAIAGLWTVWAHHAYHLPVEGTAAGRR